MKYQQSHDFKISMLTEQVSIGTMCYVDIIRFFHKYFKLKACLPLLMGHLLTHGQASAQQRWRTFPAFHCWWGTFSLMARPRHSSGEGLSLPSIVDGAPSHSWPGLGTAAVKDFPRLPLLMGHLLTHGQASAQQRWRTFPAFHCWWGTFSLMARPRHSSGEGLSPPSIVDGAPSHSWPGLGTAAVKDFPCLPLLMGHLLTHGQASAQQRWRTFPAFHCWWGTFSLMARPRHSSGEGLSLPSIVDGAPSHSWPGLGTAAVKDFPCLPLLMGHLLTHGQASAQQRWRTFPAFHFWWGTFSLMARPRHSSGEGLSLPSIVDGAPSHSWPGLGTAAVKDFPCLPLLMGHLLTHGQASAQQRWRTFPAFHCWWGTFSLMARPRHSTGEGLSLPSIVDGAPSHSWPGLGTAAVKDFPCLPLLMGHLLTHGQASAQQRWRTFPAFHCWWGIFSLMARPRHSSAFHCWWGTFSLMARPWHSTGEGLSPPSIVDGAPSHSWPGLGTAPVKDFPRLPLLMGPVKDFPCLPLLMGHLLTHGQASAQQRWRTFPAFHCWWGTFSLMARPRHSSGEGLSLPSIVDGAPWLTRSVTQYIPGTGQLPTCFKLYLQKYWFKKIKLCLFWCFFYYI